jgi:hypothetical protein
MAVVLRMGLVSLDVLIFVLNILAMLTVLSMFLVLPIGAFVTIFPVLSVLAMLTGFHVLLAPSTILPLSLLSMPGVLGMPMCFVTTGSLVFISTTAAAPCKHRP